MKDKKDGGNKAATGNIGMYMPMGLSAGMCLGLAVGSAVKNNDNDDDDEGM